MNKKFLTGPELAPLNGQQPENLVIFMHGLGSNGDDLIELAHFMQPSLPNTQFISPNAIAAYDMAAFGYQWFSLQNRDSAKLYLELESIRAQVEDYITDKLKEYNLTAANLALVGFSQGTMTALHVALRMQQQINCIVGFSGRLVASETLASDIKSKMPICLIHGERDDIVPIEAMTQAVIELQANNVMVQSHKILNLKHSIDNVALKTALDFLTNNLVK